MIPSLQAQTPPVLFGGPGIPLVFTRALFDGCVNRCIANWVPTCTEQIAEARGSENQQLVSDKSYVVGVVVVVVAVVCVVAAELLDHIWPSLERAGPAYAWC